MDVALMRELIERTIRPGQPGGSATVDRLPSAGTLAPKGHAGGNRYDWGNERNMIYAVYGRARYGGACYGRA